MSIRSNAIDAYYDRSISCQGFGHPEQGGVPSEWKVGRIGDYGAFRGGSVFPVSFQGKRSGKYPFIKVSDMNRSGNELFINGANHWIDEDAKNALRATVFPSDSIVFAKIGAAIFLERRRMLSVESCIDNNMMAFTLNDRRSCRKFFYYLLLSVRLGQFASTTALPSLSESQLAEIVVPIPPPSEQRQIASVLSGIDDLIRSIELLISKKNAVKHAAMEQLLTGAIRIPSFNVDWETVTLGEIVEIKSGSTPSTQNSTYWNGTIPWCTATDITSNPSKYLVGTKRMITQVALSVSSMNLLPTGTILLCSRATIGELKIATSPVSSSQALKAIVCHDRVLNEFLYYRLKMLKPYLIEKATGSTFLEIGKDALCAIQIQLPPHDEQSVIAEMLSDMDSEISAIEKLCRKVCAIKEGMMQQLLTGRLRLIQPGENSEEEQQP